jgi:hypothetical protein
MPASARAALASGRRVIRLGITGTANYYQTNAGVDEVFVFIQPLHCQYK